MPSMPQIPEQVQPVGMGPAEAVVAPPKVSRAMQVKAKVEHLGFAMSFMKMPPSFVKPCILNSPREIHWLRGFPVATATQLCGLHRPPSPIEPTGLRIRLRLLRSRKDSS